MRKKPLSSHAHLLKAALGNALSHLCVPCKLKESCREPGRLVKRCSEPRLLQTHVPTYTDETNALPLMPATENGSAFVSSETYRLWFRSCCGGGPHRLMPAAPPSRTFPRPGRPWELLPHGAAGSWAGFHGKPSESGSQFRRVENWTFIISELCCTWPSLLLASFRYESCTLRLLAVTRQASNESPKAFPLV